MSQLSDLVFFHFLPQFKRLFLPGSSALYSLAFIEVQFLRAKLFSNNVTQSICPVHTIEYKSLADALSKSSHHFSIFCPMHVLRDFCSLKFWQLEIKQLLSYDKFPKTLKDWFSFFIQSMVTWQLFS